VSGAHHHSHGHSHAHPVSGGHGTAFAVAVTLNTAFVITEVVAGLAGGSMALLADAGHNFGDVLALLLAWGASILAAKPPSQRFTYGFKSSSILAAIANAALLWVALGAILLETIRRLFNPEPSDGMTMLVVASIGIAINGLSAALFARGRKSNLNLRAAFQHLLADAAVSAGVVVAGLAIILTGRSWIDPVTSLLITLVIGWGSWGLLRDSLRMGMLGVPEGVDQAAVRAYLTALRGVSGVHDLHIWPMSTTENAFTAHLVMSDGHPGDGFLHEVAGRLEHDFAIHHATIQVETGGDCGLDDDEVV
jgi:cobalt-zinc-cadmium efflux system protein